MSRIVKHQDDFLADLRYAREQSGKSYLGQTSEALRLVLGPGHLSPWDYHRYRLWDDAIPWERKREYIGDNSHGWLTHQVSSLESEPILRDKISAERVLLDGGIPTTRTLAVYHPTRSLPATPVLRSAQELAAFLRERMEYPFFYKPVTGNGSAGAGLVLARDAETDTLTRRGDQPQDVEAFSCAVEESCRMPSVGAHRRPDSGYLFQVVETNHPALAEVCGPTLAGFRVYLLHDDLGPRVDRVTWKIPGQDSPADNFYRDGNLYAQIDKTSGVVKRLLQGEGRRFRVLERHPQTGKRITGLRIPFFDQLIEMVLQGAALFPGSRYAGWDVAVTADGPLVIEANFGSTFTLGQLSEGRGLLTPEFREFVRRAKKLNAGRGFLWPVSWNRDESIWRLSGLAKLARSVFTGGARSW